MIHPCPFQLRPVLKNSLEFVQLRDSIKLLGQLVPILARPRGDDLEVIDGQRRLECCRDLNREPLIHTVHMNDAQAKAAQVAANIHHFPPGNPDLARRLIGMGMPLAQVAGQLNKTQGWVKKVLCLDKLTPAGMQALDRGDISLEDAQLVARVPRKYQHEVIGIPTDDLKAIVRRLRSQIPRRQSPGGYRPLHVVLAEIQDPTEAGLYISRLEDPSPIEVWKAALRWATNFK